MDNESEVAYVRAVMDDLPTLVRSSVPGQAAGPKMGKVFGPHNTRMCGIHSERDPVQSTHPNATKEWTRGTVEPANGSLSDERRRPGRMPRRGGWLKKPMPHCNGEDTGEC
jgi:hypothetical protein